MFRNLIPSLSDKYHVVAPDYPGFGNRAQPKRETFDYTFATLAKLMNRFTEELNIKKYSLYWMDYGAPIGFLLATKHPEQIETLIVQNGNAYDEGLREFWDPIREYWQNRTAGKAVPLAGFISPDVVKWQYPHRFRILAAMFLMVLGASRASADLPAPGYAD